MQSQWIATFAWSKNRRIINMLALLLDDHLKEEACMKYINAKNLLPDALVKELQSYIQGGYLYVPADQAQQKRWGEASGYRQELQQRNLYEGVSGKILPVRIGYSKIICQK